MANKYLSFVQANISSNNVQLYLNMNWSVCINFACLYVSDFSLSIIHIFIYYYIFITLILYLNIILKYENLYIKHSTDV